MRLSSVNSSFRFKPERAVQRIVTKYAPSDTWVKVWTNVKFPVQYMKIEHIVNRIRWQINEIHDDLY